MQDSHPQPNRHIIYLFVPLIIFSLIILYFVLKPQANTTATDEQSQEFLETPTVTEAPAVSGDIDNDLSRLDNEFQEIEKAFEDFDSL